MPRRNTRQGSGATSEATGDAAGRSDSELIENLPLDSLIPYARNSRTHSEQQVAQIAGSIQEFGFCNPVLIDGAGIIIAGHGRVLAAQRLNLTHVPCRRLRHLTEAQKRAYVIADNRIALSSGWDEEMLANELSDLRADNFDLSFLGFDADELTKLLAFEGLGDDAEGEGEGGGTEAEEDNETYTNRILSPIYTPKGEKPPLTDLRDRQKADSLIAQINQSSVPDDVKKFLRDAAERHVAFNFRSIAEFYCHADATVQDLMERSGLIIIDFEKAVEYGFVHLTDRLGRIANLEQGVSHDDDSE